MITHLLYYPDSLLVVSLRLFASHLLLSLLEQSLQLRKSTSKAWIVSHEFIGNTSASIHKRNKSMIKVWK